MHVATVTLTVGLTSPLSPSVVGVEKNARNSVVDCSFSDVTYEPVGDDGVIVATVVQVDAPGGRRCSLTVRFETGLLLISP